MKNKKDNPVPSIDDLMTIGNISVRNSDIGGVDDEEIIYRKDLKKINILALLSEYYGDHSQEYETISEVVIKLRNGVETDKEQPKL